MSTSTLSIFGRVAGIVEKRKRWWPQISLLEIHFNRRNLLRISSQRNWSKCESHWSCHWTRISETPKHYTLIVKNGVMTLTLPSRLKTLDLLMLVLDVSYANHQINWFFENGRKYFWINHQPNVIVFISLLSFLCTKFQLQGALHTSRICVTKCHWVIAKRHSTTLDSSLYLYM